MVKVLSANEIEEAAALLKKGELVAFPTETVYGLGARLFSPEAIASIFSVKQRPSDNPLIVHIHDLAQLDGIAQQLPDLFFKLAHHFFPGPLTLIVKKHSAVPLIACAGLDSIAVRMPSDPIALKLISLTGEPLVAPSANLSGKPSSTSAQHVIDDFAGKIAAVVDGGKTEFGIESTVVSLLEKVPILLRPGAITQEAIEAVLGYPILVGSHSSRPVSPGMKYRHYAPKAPIKIFDALDLLQSYVENIDVNTRILLTRESIPSISMKQFLLSAQDLYGHLRNSDLMGLEEILVFCDAKIHEDKALMNRLTRASH